MHLLITQIYAKTCAERCLIDTRTAMKIVRRGLSISICFPPWMCSPKVHNPPVFWEMCGSMEVCSYSLCTFIIQSVLQFKIKILEHLNRKNSTSKQQRKSWMKKLRVDVVGRTKQTVSVTSDFKTRIFLNTQENHSSEEKET